jgi:hypothetical protein
MSSHALTKERNPWVTGVSIVLEDDSSRQSRLEEAQGYYQRREEMATQATTDLIGKGVDGPAIDSVRWFSIHTRWERTYLMPQSLPRKRWLEIRGHRIPLTSTKDQ